MTRGIPPAKRISLTGRHVTAKRVDHHLPGSRARAAGYSLCGIVLTCLWGAPPPLLAAAIPPGLDACSREPDLARRLVCYDTEIARMRSLPETAPPASGAALAPAQAPAPGAPPPPAPALLRPPASTSASNSAAAAPAAPAGAAPAVDSSAASPEDRFGMTEAIQRNTGTQPKQLDKLTGRIAGLTYTRPEQARLTLDNGQVWEQAEPEAHLGLERGDTVTIRRGLLGAFYMSSDKVRGLRVKRLR